MVLNGISFFVCCVLGVGVVVLFCVYFENESHYIVLAGLELPIRLSWLQTHRALPALAS